MFTRKSSSKMDKKQLKILLVEKQTNVANEIKKELENSGHKISVSKTTEGALLRTEAFNFDFFIISCGQDGKDGLDFAKTIVKKEGYQNVSFLFLINPMIKTDIRLLKFENNFDIMKLPLDKTELKLRMEKLLSEKNPAKKKETKKEKAAPAKSKKKADKGKVLLVEDNPLNQKVLGMFIAKLGFEYDVASNGQMAVDFTLKEEYRYVLMDIYMPGMDGTEATTIIRKNEEENGDHRAKIIAITANESEESVKRCYDSGMDDYLVKPFTLEVLKEKLV